jgi:hypothetical protein
MSDWYGTSCSFASAFSSSSIGSGSRIEMVVVDGLKFGKVARTARLQSKWKARSASSDRNWGSALGFLGRSVDLGLEPPVPATHIAG